MYVNRIEGSVPLSTTIQFTPEELAAVDDGTHTREHILRTMAAETHGSARAAGVEFGQTTGPGGLPHPVDDASVFATADIDHLTVVNGEALVMPIRGANEVVVYVAAWMDD